MKKRKTIAFALAAFVLLPLFLSGGLQLFQSFLKQRASHRLDHEVLSQVKVPVQTVKWIEEDREVMIDGKMFDLKSWSQDEHTFLAIGVWDEKETQVMEWLNHFNDQQQNNFIVRLLLVSQCLFFILLVLQLVSPFKFLLYFMAHLQCCLPASPPKNVFQPPRRLFFCLTT